MNVIMEGIDYNVAAIEVREKFSLTVPNTEKAYEDILSIEGVLGAVIISTCNRTEVYLSCADGKTVHPFEVLCQSMGLDYSRYKYLTGSKRNLEAMTHLCELACGVKSLIWGEDQIISQVKESIEFARERQACDGVLEVMFRNAVASAKKVRTILTLNRRDSSVVSRVLSMLKSRENIKNVLVIGNGEIGRLAAQELAGAGFGVTMTLRQYRHGITPVPLMVDTVLYTERYNKLAECDAVISATRSHHYTLEYDAVAELASYPGLYVDLAVPRDIDPRIAELPGTVIYNIDSMCSDGTAAQDELMAQISLIIGKYISDFENWFDYKKRLVGI